MLSNILGKTGKGKSTIVEIKRCFQILDRLNISYDLQ